MKVATVPGAPELHPPEGLLWVADRLESSGFEAWAVGGALRDAWSGEDRADWDIATSALPDQVLGLFPRTVSLGVEHGTVGVNAPDGTMYEVTTFRCDVETDGRHAVVEFADSIEEDLSRRDFTINALAWRPATGELRDPHSGAADLDRRILRAVGNPVERFAEDYLRVLRGLRFAGRYSLEFDPATRTALEEAVSGLDRLSAERVREELMKSLAGGGAGDTLRLYAETGALDYWLPELAAAASGDPRWETTLSAVDEIPTSRVFLRLVRLLLAVPREDERDEPREPGEGIVREIMERLRFSRADIRRAEILWRRYLPLLSPVDSSATVREWLAEVGRENARDLFRLHFSLARASGARESERALLHTWRRVHDELVGGAPVALSDLAVDGNDLIGLGLPKGPLVGLMLEELLAQVIEDPTRNDRPTLLAEARELIELGALDGLADGD